MIGSASALAADQLEPAPFVADIHARPISESAPLTTDAPLRWKSKAPSASSEFDFASATAQPIVQPSTSPRTSWNITRIDPSVRPAQAISSNPFSDPFGDRQTSREPALTLQPTAAESSAETLPPPRTAAPIRTSAPSPILTAAQPGFTAPFPTPGSTPPGGLSPMPGFGTAPLQQPGEPCDRIYNDRNCCDSETNCRDFRNRLLTDSIRGISLDITPRYSPSMTLEEDAADRSDKLRLLEPRQWHDRRGTLRATGKMSNIENAAVVITDESGNEVARILLQDLADDELCYVNAWWQLPIECPHGGRSLAERNWQHSAFVWHASALCHKPLYFEQVQLERYGHTAGPIRQPFISGAHFFLSIAALPYKMAINPPHECQYPLGYYRPGSCAPWMIPPIPLSLRGAAAETAVILGGIHLIP